MSEQEALSGVDQAVLTAVETTLKHFVSANLCLIHHAEVIRSSKTPWVPRRYKRQEIKRNKWIPGGEMDRCTMSRSRLNSADTATTTEQMEADFVGANHIDALASPIVLSWWRPYLVVRSIKRAMIGSGFILGFEGQASLSRAVGLNRSLRYDQQQIAATLDQHVGVEPDVRVPSRVLKKSL
jgi:hypothetical protein